MQDNIRIMITEEEIEQRTKELGEQISRDYAGNRCIWSASLRAVYIS